jgi:hypothetical protein
VDSIAFLTFPRAHSGRPHIDTQIVVNGTPLREGLIDVAALIGLAPIPVARFFLYTCGCGSAGCAGFHEPLIQRRVDGTVVWTTEDAALATVLGLDSKSALVFDAGVFDGAMATLYRDLLTFEHAGMPPLVQLSETDPNEHADPLQKRVDLIRRYGEEESRFILLVEQAIDPTLPTSVPFLWGQGQRLAAHVFEMDIESAASQMLGLRRGIGKADVEQVDAVAPTVALLQRFARDKDVAAALEAFAPFAHFAYKDACQHAVLCHEPQPAFEHSFQTVEGVPVALCPW